MKFRKAAIATLAGAALSAVTFTAAATANAAPATPAAVVHAVTHAVPEALGPGWTATQLRAFSGGGCAGPQTDSRLSPIISEACGTWTWEYRVLSNTTAGTVLEFVDQSGTFALGFSGNQFKLETPNSSVTVLNIIASDRCRNVNSTEFCLLSNQTNQDYMGPAGAGQPVMSLTPTANTPTSAWTFNGLVAP